MSLLDYRHFGEHFINSIIILSVNNNQQYITSNHCTVHNCCVDSFRIPLYKLSSWLICGEGVQVLHLVKMPLSTLSDSRLDRLMLRMRWGGRTGRIHGIHELSLLPQSTRPCSRHAQATWDVHRCIGQNVRRYLPYKNWLDPSSRCRSRTLISIAFLIKIWGLRWRPTGWLAMAVSLLKAIMSARRHVTEVTKWFQLYSAFSRTALDLRYSVYDLSRCEARTSVAVSRGSFSCS